MDTAVAKVEDFGKLFRKISIAALITAGHAACKAGTTPVNSSYFATGALMVVGVLDRETKVAANFGHRNNAAKKLT